MNAPGQIVLTQALQDWGSVLNETEISQLLDSGVKSLHAVIGLMEFPLFSTGLPKSSLYLYSVEGPKLSTLARLLTRFESSETTSDTAKRLGDFPESAFAAALRLSPLGRSASREGWGAFRISGHMTQGDDPALFPAIFYEMSLDVAGDTTVFFPTSSPRHYDVISLEAAALDDLSEARIWGFEEVAFNLSDPVSKKVFV